MAVIYMSIIINNIYIDAIVLLLLITHSQSGAELLVFGPKCTLPF